MGAPPSMAEALEAIRERGIVHHGLEATPTFVVTPAATLLRVNPRDRLLSCDLAVGLRSATRSDS
jgi:hypothetical protein